MKLHNETRCWLETYVDLNPPSNTMQMRLYLILALLMPAVVSAQTGSTAPAPQRASLSLDEAITLARRHNPVHLATINNRRTADAAVRTANGQLLPSADASFFAQRQQGGRQIFGGTTSISRSTKSALDTASTALRFSLRSSSARTGTRSKPTSAGAPSFFVPASRSNISQCFRRRIARRFRTHCSLRRRLSWCSRKRARWLDRELSSMYHEPK
jgi:hypothetical protein